MVVIKIQELQELLDELNDNLIYTSSKIEGNTLTIKCDVKKLKYHLRGHKPRVIQDINYKDYMIIIIVNLPVYYADSTSRKAFIHPLTCCEPRNRRTKRLNEYLLNTIKNSKSSLEAEREIRGKVCDVSDTTINRLIKKNNFN